MKFCKSFLVNTSTRLRPFCLALYKASSAVLTRVSTLSEISDEEFQSIENEYDSLAVVDMESAYKFLIEQANKYNIDKAIAA